MDYEQDLNKMSGIVDHNTDPSCQAWIYGYKLRLLVVNNGAFSNRVYQAWDRFWSE